jgi:hypothetical protein
MEDKHDLELVISTADTHTAYKLFIWFFYTVMAVMVNETMKFVTGIILSEMLSLQISGCSWQFILGLWLRLLHD